MAVLLAIMAKIIQCVALDERADYREWRIGITHDVQERYRQWRRPERFRYWELDSLEEAQKIESYFIHFKGMQGGTGGDLDPERKAFVYIF